MNKEIRRDIFAVKVLEDGRWSLEFMAMKWGLAENKRKEIRERAKLHGAWWKIKIVHPQQWQVDGYVAAGNKIVE